MNNLFLVYVVLSSHVLGSALVNDWLKEFLEFIEYSRSLFFKCLVSLGFPGGSDGKESASMFGRPGFNPWVGKNPSRREWLPTPVFLPGKISSVF